MTEAVYTLCAVTSVLCAVLLLRRYQQSRTRLLLWTSLCFVGLAANNLFLVLDSMVFPTVDLSTVRAALAAGAAAVLLLGLAWDAR